MNLICYIAGIAAGLFLGVADLALTVLSFGRKSLERGVQRADRDLARLPVEYAVVLAVLSAACFGVLVFGKALIRLLLSP